MIQQIWSADHIGSIEIACGQTISLEGRASFYEHVGVIQSHVVQVMSMVTMDPLSQIAANELRDAKGAAICAARL